MSACSNTSALDLISAPTFFIFLVIIKGFITCTRFYNEFISFLMSAAADSASKETLVSKDGSFNTPIIILLILNIFKYKPIFFDNQKMIYFMYKLLL